MKKLLCICLCAALCAVSAMGCSPRGDPATESSPAGESAPSLPDPSSAPEPDPAPSSEPEQPAAPLPELTDTELKLLQEQLLQFANYFGDRDGPATPQEFYEADALQFCLSMADRQKDLYGYYFEQDDDGHFLISSAVVEETAQRLLGLEGFSPTGTEGYDGDLDCYRYAPAETAAPQYALGAPQGAPDGGISYDVEFFGGGSEEPSYTLRFTFKLGRLNGMPYLQLLSKQAV